MSDIEALKKQNEKLKNILRQCLRARQINHVRQIIREALGDE
jgi:hypothetical protein